MPWGWSVRCGSGGGGEVVLPTHFVLDSLCLVGGIFYVGRVCEWPPTYLWRGDEVVGKGMELIGFLWVCEIL